jgi:hypothetical protein
MPEGIRPAARIAPAEPVRVQPTREQANQSRREQANRSQPHRPPPAVPEAEQPSHNADAFAPDTEPQQLDVEI